MADHRDADLVEAAAMLLHEQLHRAGSGQTCTACRELAACLDALYRPQAPPLLRVLTGG